MSRNTEFQFVSFLLTPLREGRPVRGKTVFPFSAFLLTPLREGRRRRSARGSW